MTSTPISEATQKLIAEFQKAETGALFNTMAKRLALVARIVRNGRATKETLPGKISAEELSTETDVSRATISRYVKMWDLAAAESLVATDVNATPVDNRPNLDNLDIDNLKRLYKEAITTTKPRKDPKPDNKATSDNTDTGDTSPTPDETPRQQAETPVQRIGSITGQLTQLSHITLNSTETAESMMSALEAAREAFDALTAHISTYLESESVAA